MASYVASSVTAANGGSPYTATDSPSWSQTVAQNANNNAVVVLIHFGDALATVNSVTVGGVSATQIGRGVRTGATSHAAEMWVAVGVSDGSQAVSVSMSAVAEVFGTSLELQDVHQTTPVRDSATGGAFTDTAEPSLTVTSDASDVVLDALAMNGTTLPTVGTGQTSLRNTNNSDIAAASYEGGASSVTMSWSGIAPASFTYGHVAASFQSPAGGGSPPAAGQAVITIPVTSDGA